MRAMVAHMLQADASKRLSARQYLQSWLPSPFPAYFQSHLHAFFSDLLPLSTDKRIMHTVQFFVEIQSHMAGSAPKPPVSPARHPSRSPHRVKGADSRSRAAGEVIEGMPIMASLLCSLLRKAKLPHSTRACVHLLSHVSLHCDDSTRLQTIVPFLVSLLVNSRDAAHHQNSSVVKCAALTALAEVLASVESVPASEAQMMVDYVLPGLSGLSQNQEDSVCVAYAEALPVLAQTGLRFLQQKESMAEAMAQLREAVQSAVEELATGDSPVVAVRKSLLQNMPLLCLFFGRKYSNNFLLPLLITFLNDRQEQVRAAFYERLAASCDSVEPISMEAFVLPCVEQALNDSAESVIVSALACLRHLCSKSRIRKPLLLGAARQAAPLLCHPSAWVRSAALTLFAAIGTFLSPVDSHAHLGPTLAPFMTRTPAAFSTEQAIAACLRPSISRELFQSQLRNLLLPMPLSATTRAPTEPTKLFPPIDSLMMSAVHTYAQQSSAVMRSRMVRNDGRQLADSEAHSGLLGPHGPVYGGVPVYSVVLKGTPEDVAAMDPPQPSVAVGEASHRMKPIGTSQLVALSAMASVGSRSAGGAAAGRDVAGMAGIDAELFKSSDNSWRPKGVLVSHLQEHRGAVNALAVVPHGSFFGSASDDGSVRVWDCRRIESEGGFSSRLQYSGLGDRVTCLVTTGENSLAAASSNGRVEVLDIDYVVPDKVNKSAERYRGILAAQGPSPGSHGCAVTSLQCVEASLLLYSTLQGGIQVWDTRMQAAAGCLYQNPREGYVSCSTLQPGGHWVLSATSRGVFSLWDLRFRVRAGSWVHPGRCFVDAVAALYPGVGGPASGVSPGGGRLPLVYAAAGKDEIGLWNAESGACLLVLRVVTSADSDPSCLSETPKALLGVSHGSLQLEEGMGVDALTSPPPRLPGVRSILPVRGGAGVIAAGTDCTVRLWDRLRPDKSYVVSGPTILSPKGDPEKSKYDSRLISKVRVLQEIPAYSLGQDLSSPATEGRKESAMSRALKAAARDLSGCHRDSVLSMAVAATHAQSLLVTSSRDGCIKVWR